MASEFHDIAERVWNSLESRAVGVTGPDVIERVIERAVRATRRHPERCMCKFTAGACNRAIAGDMLLSEEVKRGE